MLIDCDSCAVRGPACGDCVVTVLLAAPAVVGGPAASRDRVAEPAEVVELDAGERAALAVLAGSGLVPPLRLEPAVPASGPGAVDAAGRGVPDDPDRAGGRRRAAG